MAYSSRHFCPGQASQPEAAVLAALPGRHGTQSNQNRNVRRRLNKKWDAETAALADGAVAPSTNSQIDPSNYASVACLDPGYPVYDPPCQRGPPFLPDIARDVTVYHAHIDPSRFPRKPGSAVPPSPDQEQSRGEEHGSAQRRDSGENGRLSNSVSPLQQAKNRPVLTASATSAEIVEALMPDLPAPVRLPRRTASVRYCEKRKIALKIAISAEFGKRRA